ncbi:hypothetical protein PMIN02_011687 [Paraphaeosphaeria minitans]
MHEAERMKEDQGKRTTTMKWVDDGGVVGEHGACGVAGRALTGPLPAMRRRFPARHVGGRDARDTAGRNARRSEIERSPSQQLGLAHTHTQRLVLVVVVTAARPACLLLRARVGCGQNADAGRDGLATTRVKKPCGSGGGGDGDGLTTAQRQSATYEQAMSSRVESRQHGSSGRLRDGTGADVSLPSIY